MHLKFRMCVYVRVCSSTHACVFKCVCVGRFLIGIGFAQLWEWLASLKSIGQAVIKGRSQDHQITFRLRLHRHRPRLLFTGKNFLVFGENSALLWGPLNWISQVHSDYRIISLKVNGLGPLITSAIFCFSSNT